MKKSLIIAAIVLCMILTIVYAASLTKEQKRELDVCKKGCLNESKNSLKSCDSEKRTCLDTCKNESVACNANVSLQKNVCIDSCQLEFDLVINQSLDRALNDSLLNDSLLKNASKAFRECKKTCQVNATATKREHCGLSQCRNECAKEKQECVDARNDARLACFDVCQVAVLNQTNANQTNGSLNETHGNQGCNNHSINSNSNNNSSKHEC